MELAVALIEAERQQATGKSAAELVLPPPSNSGSSAAPALGHQKAASPNGAVVVEN